MGWPADGPDPGPLGPDPPSPLPDLLRGGGARVVAGVLRRHGGGVVTAQGRVEAREATWFVLQKCEF